MKNSQNITIVLLLVTAAILSTVLALTFTGTSQQSYAETSDRYWGYIVTTGKIATTTDAMYIIDVDNKRLNAYTLHGKKRSIDLLESIDLAKVFKSAR